MGLSVIMSSRLAWKMEIETFGPKAGQLHSHAKLHKTSKIPQRQSKAPTKHVRFQCQ
jgi:hypothetical protein